MNLHTRNALYLGILLILSGGKNIVAQENFYEDLMRFSSILNHIQYNYVDETNPRELIDASIQGILRTLDPHSIYFPPERVGTYESLISEPYIGVGIEFTIIQKRAVVVSILKGGPSDGKGIRTGHILTAIDNKALEQVTEPELRVRLRGKEKTKVKLTFSPPIKSYTYDVEIERAPLLNKTVQSLLLPNQVGYIQLSEFQAESGKELIETLQSLVKQKASAIILDLRDNPGGVLQASLEILDAFVPRNTVILETRGRKDVINEIFKSEKKPILSNQPLVVLINEGSASASEVVAGSLQDLDRAVLVGTNSFGKGLVQSPFFLPNGGVLMMTIARYYTPSGRLIQRDYDSISFEEYYKERKIDTASLPTFNTSKGRTVYGGGGIFPDVLIEQKDLSEFVSKLIQFGIIKQYVIQMLPRVAETLTTPEALEVSIDLDRTLLDTFSTEQVVWDDTIVDAHAKEIEKAIIQEIIRVHWGKETLMLYNFKDDVQFQKALEVFSTYDAILNGN